MLNNCQLNNFQITKQIGSGAYGVVFHAIDLVTENEYAIKAIMKSSDDPLRPKASMGGSSSSLKKSAVLQTQLYHYFKSFQNKLFLPTVDLDSVLAITEEQLCHAPHYREIQLQLRCHMHENVVTIHQILESSLATFVVMDYYPMDLFTSIVENQHFSNDGLLIKKAFLQLCSVIHHCHTVGVYHCDIKPENILLDANDNVKLCDFGLATTAPYINANVCVGSSYYMAPERVSCPSSILHSAETQNNEGHQMFPTASGDVWSLGIILINLTCIRNPWLKAHQKHDNTFKYFINDARVLTKILPLSEDLFNILNSILQVDPTKRTDLISLIKAVSKCEHFTTSGPLSVVPSLTPRQLNHFICGDYSMKIKNMVSKFDSLNADLEEDLSESSDELYRDYDIGSNTNFPGYSSEEDLELMQEKSNAKQTPFPNTTITPDGYLSQESPSKLWLTMQYSQFNLSTNDSQNTLANSTLESWLPRY
ncbi:Serine/threonine-protein kinase SKS1 [Kluyveromyces marxianus]